MEIIVYQGLTYFPLIVLGVDSTVILCIAVVGTLIGHLNHSNLDLTWGPLRYVMNSPRMHVWHHALELPKNRRFGVNFGISLKHLGLALRNRLVAEPTRVARAATGTPGVRGNV